MRVLGENIDELSPLGFLLGQGGTEEHSLSKHKIQRYFRISKMAAKRRLRNRKKGQFSS
jgi:hypothetical protein